ncbi:MAG TPA: serine protease [Verrucomicrobiae bacterium]
MPKSYSKTKPTSQQVNLRAIDQETARVVAVLDKRGTVVGAGCLIDGKRILTCYHVVEAALGRSPAKNAKILVKLMGVSGQPEISTRIEKLGKYASKRHSVEDLALLKFGRLRGISEAEFATPLRHGGKRYSVLGFPDSDLQGRNASGVLHAANAAGLVQMDGNSALFVKGGFSGAPVWSSDLRAFVGMVVSELSNTGVAWCIPSRVLCAFHPNLPVRFRIPLADRPEIHDRSEDDPNVQLFGKLADNGQRKLEGRAVWNEEGGYYDVKVIYKRISGAPPLRGKYVTFITYPDFLEDDVDAYELFSEIEDGKAWTKIYPEDDLFAIAAIGDGGDTALTLDLFEVEEEPEDDDD